MANSSKLKLVNLWAIWLFKKPDSRQKFKILESKILMNISYTLAAGRRSEIQPAIKCLSTMGEAKKNLMK